MATLNLTLKEARELFKLIKDTCIIDVTIHAYKDHPERRFDVVEIEDIVRRSMSLHKNNSREAIKYSFLLIANDDKHRQCKMSLLFKKDRTTDTYIVVCHAHREV